MSTKHIYIDIEKIQQGRSYVAIIMHVTLMLNFPEWPTCRREDV